MEIILAENAGFCFGVSKAVNTAYSLAGNKSGNIYTLGAIIHNNTVIKELADNGVKVIDDLENIERGCTVIIRAHGISKAVYERLSGLNVNVVDATCPFVRKIHNLVTDKYNEGYRIVITGDREHPEVKGINGWCGNSAIIISEPDDVSKLDKGTEKYCVVSQTTFSVSKWQLIINEIKKQFDKFIYFDTICIATVTRQEEAAKVAETADLMIVIGDRMSSNTLKLVEICSLKCPETFLIESFRDLKGIDFKNIKKVGVTAGASAPEPVIREVINYMSEINTITNANMDNFEAMLEESLTTLTTGQTVSGNIIRVDEKGVFIDLGFKYEGFVYINEFKDQPSVGDEVEAVVTRISDKDGEVLLSKRRIDSKKNIKLIEEAYMNKTPITVRVKELVNGGIVGIISGIRVFIPASQVDTRYIEDLTQFLNTDMDVKIITFKKGDKNRLKIVGSHRVIMDEIRAKADEEFWSDIEVGKVYTGTIKHITNFGAYVDIGGIDGLVYRSELSWKKIRHPSEVVAVGNVIDVYVIKFDTETKKVTLGYKKASENPWKDIHTKYDAGDVVTVKVVKFVKYGVFAEIEPGLDGLVHISQISNVRLNKPQEALTMGQVVEAKIVDLNMDLKKISLSIKEVNPIDPIETYEEDYADEDLVEDDFGSQTEEVAVADIAEEGSLAEDTTEVINAEALNEEAEEENV